MSDNHLVTTVEQLERIYGEPYGPSILKVADHVTPHYRAFIEAAPFFALASCGRTGSTARRAATRRASCACRTRRRC